MTLTQKEKEYQRNYKRQYFKRNPGKQAKHAEQTRKNYDFLKSSVINMYGNKCYRCEYPHKKALELEPLTQAMMDIKSFYRRYTLARKNYDPKSWRVTCKNCKAIFTKKGL